MIIKTAPAATGPMNKGEAIALTQRIRQHIDAAWEDITKAYEGKAWKAMLYPSWEAYVKAEFDMGRSRAYQLIDQGKVIAALRSATGDLSTDVDISEAAARDIKSDLPAVADEIKTRVADGEAPKKAVAQAVAAKRAEKEQKREERKVEQAKNDAYREENRAALPAKVQQQEQARAAAKAKKPEGLPADDRIAELEEHVRFLEAENADLKERIKKFSEMEAEYKKGGFAEVERGKQEVIDAMKTRIERESADKASWKRTADMWRKRAEDSGWSNEVAIDIETGVVGRA